MKMRWRWKIQWMRRFKVPAKSSTLLVEDLLSDTERYREKINSRYEYEVRMSDTWWRWMRMTRSQVRQQNIRSKGTVKYEGKDLYRRGRFLRREWNWNFERSRRRLGDSSSRVVTDVGMRMSSGRLFQRMGAWWKKERSVILRRELYLKDAWEWY